MRHATEEGTMKTLKFEGATKIEVEQQAADWVKSHRVTVIECASMVLRCRARPGECWTVSLGYYEMVCGTERSPMLAGEY